jgi:protein SCO1/2
MPSRKTAVFSVLAAIAIGVIAAILSGAPEPVAIRSGTALPEPRPIADFDLIDQHGRALTREVFAGRWSIVFAGFTNCPDVCPTTLALLTALSSRVRARGDDLQIVFLSVDPDRDTSSLLAQYVGHFDPGMIGATGAKAQIDRLCAELGLAYVLNPGAAGEYTVDHSAALVLVDPKARIAAYFQPPFDPDQLATDLATLAAAQS